MSPPVDRWAPDPDHASNPARLHGRKPHPGSRPSAPDSVVESGQAIVVDLDADVGFEVHPVALPHHEALSAGVDDDTMTVTLEPAAHDPPAARSVRGREPDRVGANGVPFAVELEDRVVANEPGDELELTYLRDGETATCKPVLERWYPRP